MGSTSGSWRCVLVRPPCPPSSKDYLNKCGVVSKVEVTVGGIFLFDLPGVLEMLCCLFSSDLWFWNTASSLLERVVNFEMQVSKSILKMYFLQFGI